MLNLKKVTQFPPRLTDMHRLAAQKRLERIDAAENLIAVENELKALGELKLAAEPYGIDLYDTLIEGKNRALARLDEIERRETK